MGGNGHTVSLDSSTLEILEQLARSWGVTKEEAMRRAVAQAEARPASTTKPDRLQAFKDLQRRLQLTPEKAASWQASVREGRR